MLEITSITQVKSEIIIYLAFSYNVIMLHSVKSSLII